MLSPSRVLILYILIILLVLLPLEKTGNVAWQPESHYELNRGETLRLDISFLGGERYILGTSTLPAQLYATQLLVTGTKPGYHAVVLYNSEARKHTIHLQVTDL